MASLWQSQFPWAQSFATLNPCAEGAQGVSLLLSEPGSDANSGALPPTGSSDCRSGHTPCGMWITLKQPLPCKTALSATVGLETTCFIFFFLFLSSVPHKGFWPKAIIPPPAVVLTQPSRRRLNVCQRAVGQLKNPLIQTAHRILFGRRDRWHMRLDTAHPRWNTLGRYICHNSVFSGWSEHCRAVRTPSLLHTQAPLSQPSPHTCMCLLCGIKDEKPWAELCSEAYGF